MEKQLFKWELNEDNPMNPVWKMDIPNGFVVYGIDESKLPNEKPCTVFIKTVDTHLYLTGTEIVTIERQWNFNYLINAKRFANKIMAVLFEKEIKKYKVNKKV